MVFQQPTGRRDILSGERLALSENFAGLLAPAFSVERTFNGSRFNGKPNEKRGRQMSQGATHEGTTRYAEKFRGAAAEGHFRQAESLVVSSLGIGTYLGQPNDATDASYTAAIVAAVES